MSLISPTVLTGGGTGSAIVAQLGPTNTGKTHRAIERMIEHGGGMIGLPLRLLAREVYDRIAARVGVEQVALLTGEERVEPRGARYWVCTVESMPLTRAVPFVAVDEIQLATHPRRGHVFTDRLLNARGTRETWFLGSDTMAPVLERLTPTARIERHARLSALHYEDPRELSALPRRTAVIAFSIAHVYELAERLRASHGGAAVVLGALSPRARNAQVAMFESGEVDYLVSTDAIGMGLNLDIRHVTFGALQKYDGQEVRRLEAWEIGQIAGRAGRHTRDGRFGLTRACADQTRLPPGLIEAVCRQEFAPIRKVYWRHGDLDTGSVEALREGLCRQPFHGCLVHAREQEDAQALELLLQMEDVARVAARGPEQVALLWDVCRIPNYRQSSEAAHARLLAEVYRQLTGKFARVQPDWIDRNLRRLEQLDGNIDALMQRIAHARTWAYIAHRADWLADTDRWRDRVLDLEEALSAALHAQLTHSFVEERAGLVAPRPTPHEVELDGDRVLTRTIPLGRIVGFSFVSDPEADRIFGHKENRRHGRRAAEAAARAQADALLASDAEPLAWSDRLEITWRGQPLARLARGAAIDAPEVRARPMDLLPEDLRRRVKAHVEAWVKEALRACQSAATLPDARGPIAGLLYLVASRLGAIPRHEAADQIKALSDKDKKTLARLKVRLGLRFVFAQPMLKPAHQALRAACWAAWLDLDATPELPGDAVSIEVDWPEPLADALGYPRLGPRCVRADMFERTTAHLRLTVTTGPTPLPTEPMQWLGCDRPQWEAMLASLGYTLRDDGLHPPPARKRRPQRRDR